MRPLTTLPLLLLIGCATQATAPAPPTHSPPPAPLREGFTVATATPEALNQADLDALRANAAAENSSALIVVHDGAIVLEEYFGGDPDLPIMAMSVTKSVAALGIGAMIDKQVITLDEPLADRVVPEWKGSDRAPITLRHLMNHTSGLDPVRYLVAEGPTPRHERTIARHVLQDTPLRTSPGEVFAYNNNAVDFLSVVARRANPEHLYFDDVLQWTIFGPLHATGAMWSKDGRGDPRAAGELMIRPIDLAKIGQLVLDRGVWQGERVLSEAWIDVMLAQGQEHTDQCGLLWWRDGRPDEFFLDEARLARWKERVEASDDLLQKARPMLGQRFSDLPAAEARLAALIGAEQLASLKDRLARANTWLLNRTTEVLAYRADGWLGQYVVVVPSARLIAVRMRDGRRTSWNPEEFTYGDFRWDVLKLAGYDIPKEHR